MPGRAAYSNSVWKTLTHRGMMWEDKAQVQALLPPGHDSQSVPILQPGIRAHPFSRLNIHIKKNQHFLPNVRQRQCRYSEQRGGLRTAARSWWREAGFCRAGQWLGAALLQHPPPHTLHRQGTCQGHKHSLDPSAKPLLLPGRRCSPTASHTSLRPSFPPRFAEETSLIYFFPSLRCHLAGLYQIFADGVSMPQCLIVHPSFCIIWALEATPQHVSVPERSEISKRSFCAPVSLSAAPCLGFLESSCPQKEKDDKQLHEDSD